MALIGPHKYASLFKYDHLPEVAKIMSKPFCEMAQTLMYPRLAKGIDMDRELMDQALLKIWEAKNLAVMAVIRATDES